MIACTIYNIQPLFTLTSKLILVERHFSQLFSDTHVGRALKTIAVQFPITEFFFMSIL